MRAVSGPSSPQPARPIVFLPPALPLRSIPRGEAIQTGSPLPVEGAMRTLRGLFTTWVLLLLLPSAWAQDTSGAGAGAASPSDSSSSQGDQGEGGPTVSNSTVGYIDNAIP